MIQNSGGFASFQESHRCKLSFGFTSLNHYVQNVLEGKRQPMSSFFSARQVKCSNQRSQYGYFPISSLSRTFLFSLGPFDTSSPNFDNSFSHFILEFPCLQCPILPLYESFSSLQITVNSNFLTLILVSSLSLNIGFI